MTNDLLTHLLTLIMGGILGALLGVVFFWLLSGRPKSQQIETLDAERDQLKIELVELQKTRQADAEKLQWLEYRGYRAKQKPSMKRLIIL